MTNPESEEEARARYRKESEEIRKKLKEDTGDAQDELLRRVVEIRKKRPGDHGMLPGR